MVNFFKYAAIAALLCCAAFSVSAAPRQSDVEAYRALVAQDSRLATIGYRLAKANAVFCNKLERKPGWVLHDVAQYPDRETAYAAFGQGLPVQIAAIIAGGPADMAGLEVGDSYYAKGDQDRIALWSTRIKHKQSYETIRRIKSDIYGYLNAPDVPVNGLFPFQFKRDEDYFIVNVKAAPVCASDFQIDTKKGLNAAADGKIVSISAGMAVYASDDEELAAVVAHELSHNILEHRKKLDEKNTKRGIGRLFGKSRKAILATEIEADQLSVWLMKNAGYGPRAAIRFWERFGREHGKGIFTEGTHLRWKNRVKILQAEIDQIEMRSTDDMPLQPPLLKQASQAAKVSVEDDEGDR